MSLLLDTHVFIWWVGDRAHLGKQVRDVIADAERVAVSIASAWEAAIKVSKGKLKLPQDFEAGAIASGFVPLPITFAHTNEVARLPWHHNDPFDRLLIAQARIESLRLVTADRVFQRYDVSVVTV